MVKRSNTADQVARVNNAAWDAFHAIRKIILEETNSATLQRLANRKYKAIDYTKPAKWPGLDGQKQMGAHAWIDLTIPPQIVADVRKALKYSDIQPDIKALLAELTVIYTRLRAGNPADHTYTLIHLRELLQGRWGSAANVVNF